MKPLIAFLLGAVTGACVLWFGFSKSLMTVNDRLVMVDRFTGKASRVFVASQETDQLEKNEAARLQALNENAGSDPEKAQWRQLEETELKQLGFRWYPKTGYQGQIYIAFHNPFEKEVWVERIRVQIPPHNERAAIDREYDARDAHFPPLADSSHLISTNLIYEDYYEKPTAASSSTTAASITPARIWIRK